MTWRTAAQHAFMWAIRYTPLPWDVKQWGITTVLRRTVVAGIALIPDADGRILLLRARYSGRWIAPGGAVHPGEDPLTGTRRECREELGLEVEPRGLVGLYAVARTGVLFVAFRCAPLADPPRLSAEHEAYRYMPVAELPWHLRIMAEDMARIGADSPAVRTIG
ncbi:MAG: hypothetical protein C4290_02275 [Chloroflexota bacterium]